MLFDDDDYVPIQECAERLNMSSEEVMELVRQRVLKAVWDGGQTFVQAALISGVTT